MTITANYWILLPNHFKRDLLFLFFLVNNQSPEKFGFPDH